MDMGNKRKSAAGGRTSRPPCSDAPHFVPLPEWGDAEQRYYDGDSDPIDEFVFHNEPAGEQDAIFRQQLQEALDHAYVLGLSASKHPNTPAHLQGRSEAEDM